MKSYRTIALLVAFLVLGFVNATAQGKPASRTRAGDGGRCPLSGAYRIDLGASDKLYSVVKGATSSVPFGEQQRFFMDLSIRLTPPDLLAIECRGQEVSVGSSRAPKATYFADGKTRQERTPDGNTVYSRVALDRDTLTFTSKGKAADNILVAFKSAEGGQRLSVTRTIYAEQLNQPIVIHSVYDKMADTVNWGTDLGPQTASRTSAGRTSHAPINENASASRSSASGTDQASALRHALDDWIDATNGRNIDRQISYYMPTLEAFYLSRNTPLSAVKLEKRKAFDTARSIDIRADEPEIVFQDGGRTAVMRFRKSYRIAERSRTRSGEVIQELRWRRTDRGWRIFSERDVRVIR